jgi:hypothetical protein
VRIQPDDYYNDDDNHDDDDNNNDDDNYLTTISDLLNSGYTFTSTKRMG